MNGKIVQGMDLLELIENIAKRNKKFQAIMLGEIETVVPKDSEEFRLIRKAILDGMNKYTRSVLKVIFGTDFE